VVGTRVPNSPRDMQDTRRRGASKGTLTHRHRIRVRFGPQNPTIVQLGKQLGEPPKSPGFPFVICWGVSKYVCLGRSLARPRPRTSFGESPNHGKLTPFGGAGARLFGLGGAWPTVFGSGNPRSMRDLRSGNGIVAPADLARSMAINCR